MGEHAIAIEREKLLKEFLIRRSIEPLEVRVRGDRASIVYDTHTIHLNVKTEEWWIGWGCLINQVSGKLFEMIDTQRKALIWTAPIVWDLCKQAEGGA